MLEANKIIDRKFKYLISIPCLNEFGNIQETITSLEACDTSILENTLIVVVVNNRQNSAALDNNQQTLIWLRSYKTILNLAWLDRSSTDKELPKKRGVGAARSLGFEFGKPYMQDQSIYIWLDADTLVESNYLTAIAQHYQNTKELSGAWVPFCHRSRGDKREDTAIAAYDRHLAYFESGLHFCGSIYAFPTIGSTISSTRRAYEKAGGVKAKRMAGEDFYFMQQLIKTGSSIEKVEGTCIYPSARVSDRVPFGTGKAVGEIIENDCFMSYSPECFYSTRRFIACVLANLNKDGAWLITQQDRGVQEWLIERDFETSWGKILQNCKTEIQMRSQFFSWFDSFQTLKLIHYLTEAHFPAIDITKVDIPEFVC